MFFKNITSFPLIKSSFILLFALLISIHFGCTGSYNQPLEQFDKAWYDTSGKDSRPDPVYIGVHLQSLYIPMRDGIKIAIDVYLPESLEPSEKIPAILLQTRYWRNYELHWPISEIAGIPEELRKIVGGGYAVVRADVRGTGASFGSRACPWSEDEIKDGAEIVDWIIAQPWCSGKVGAAGGSYEGTSAEMLLINKHPAVKAVAPLFSLYDVYTDIAFPGGVHLEWFTRVWEKGNYYMDTNQIEKLAWYGPFVTWGVRPVDNDKKRKELSRAVKEHYNNYHVHKEALQLEFRDDVSPGGFTPDSLSPHSFQGEIDQSGAAVYSISGWFDGGYANSAIKRYLNLKTKQKKLLLGPWDHGGDDHFRPFGKPIRSRFDLLSELKRFFDYHLKGYQNGFYDEAPVHYYTMVQDRWKHAKSWPPPSTPTPFFLNSGGSLSINQPQNEVGNDQYIIDSDHSTGEKARWNSLAVGLAVQYPKRRQKDRLLQVYDSELLEKDIEMTGHPVASLFIRSDKDDATLFVYLEDVDEKGNVSYVTEGNFRAVHRKISDKKPSYKSPAPFHSFERKDALPLVPGQIVHLQFELHPVSYLFRKGHRIRLAVGGADKNHFRTLEDPPTAITFEWNKSNPSSVILPIVHSE